MIVASGYIYNKFSLRLVEVPNAVVGINLDAFGEALV